MDGGCKLVLTADGSFRGTKLIELKNIVDQVRNQKTVSYFVHFVIVEKKDEFTPLVVDLHLYFQGRGKRQLTP